MFHLFHFNIIASFEHDNFTIIILGCFEHLALYLLLKTHTINARNSVIHISQILTKAQCAYPKYSQRCNDFNDFAPPIKKCVRIWDK